MGQTIRVSLPGVDAGTATDIDGYALYADEDNVLIKESERGTIGVAPNSTGTVNHGLGYIPLVTVFCNVNGTNTYVTGQDLSTSFPVQIYLDSQDIFLQSKTNFYGTMTFSYYIFYDQVE